MALQAPIAAYTLIVPRGNADEAALVQDCEILAADHFLQVCAHLTGSGPLSAYINKAFINHRAHGLDLADVRGQYRAPCALQIAAAGGHNMLMVSHPERAKPR